MRILLAGPPEGCQGDVAHALSSSGHDVAVLAAGELSAQALAERRPDVVGAFVEQPDPEALRQLACLASEAALPVVLFAGAGEMADLAQAAEGGLIVCAAPHAGVGLVQAALCGAVAQARRVRHLQEELARLRDALHERKVIERAKGLLMAHRGMTEDQAYRSLRKLAMDRNRRLVVVAESVIELSDFLQQSA